MVTEPQSAREESEKNERRFKAAFIWLQTKIFFAAGVCPEQSFHNMTMKYSRALNELQEKN